MIEVLFPPAASCVEAFEDPPDVVLFPEEAESIARAVDKRRREFSTVRHCARRALARLGVPPVPILRGERGAPRWPDGIVGAMTHTAGYRAAVVARASDLATVGVDAEPHGPLPERVLPVIALPGEQERLAELAAKEPGIHWDRMLFCAKETVYKAWFPLARRWLGFEDADIVLDPGGAPPRTDDGDPGARIVVGTFTARLLVEDRPRIAGTVLDGFTGRWLVGAAPDGSPLVVTAIAVPASGVSQAAPGYGARTSV